MESHFRSPSSLQASPPRKGQRNAPSYIGLLSRGLRSARCALYSLRFRLRNALCIYKLSLRSFRGHIGIQSAKEPLGLTVGPAAVSTSAQSAAQLRTIARALYIEMLSATYPWVDIPDLRIFLMGFDAGEQWGCHTKDSGIEMPKEDQASSWLALAEKTLAPVPARVQEMTKRPGAMMMESPQKL